MYIYLTFIILILYVLLALAVSSRCIVSPFVVVSGLFTFSIGITLINLQNWNIQINLITNLVILFGIASFGYGQIINSLLISHHRKTTCQMKVIKKKAPERRVSLWATLFFALLQLIFMIAFSLFIIKIGGGIHPTTIINARVAILLYSIPNIYGQIILFSRAIAMVYIYLLIKKKLNLSRGLDFKWYILTIIPYAIIELLSTSRAGFLYIIGYTLTVFTLLYQQKRGYTFKVKAKLVKSVVLYAIIFVLIFITLGLLTGKTQQLGVFDMVSVYTAGSIPNLDFFLETTERFNTPKYFTYTFPIVTSIATYLGLNTTTTDELYYPQRLIPGASTYTNLYTGFTKIIIDWGIFGMFLFLLILGLLYSYLYKRVTRYGYTGYLVVVYGYMMMPLFVFSFEYAVGSFVFSPNGLYTFIYLWLIYLFCFKIRLKR